jgi:hypothetical protein
VVQENSGQVSLFLSGLEPASQAWRRSAVEGTFLRPRFPKKHHLCVIDILVLRRMMT